VRLDPGARLISSSSKQVPDESGRGPAFGRTLKPDVLAPGVAVLAGSLEVEEPSQQIRAAYGLVSGASVATAHAAGGAALLLQARPNWSAEQIKAALVSTADTDVRSEANPTVSAGPLVRGGGLVALASAADTTVLPSPASVALPAMRPGESTSVAITLSDLRPAGGARTLNVGMSAGLAAAADSGVTILTSSQVALAPTAPGTLFVSMELSPAASQGDYEGDLLLTGTGTSIAGTGTSIHIPVWVRVAPAAAPIRVLLLDNDFSYFEDYRDYAPYIEQALADAGVSYVTYDADAAFGGPQTIPSLGELQGYDAIVWITGDNVHPDGYYVPPTPLTYKDQAILADYLDSGGRLLAMGQNLAQASDIAEDDDETWGRSKLLHGYLGAHWLQGQLYGPDALPPGSIATVTGHQEGFLAGVALDLGPIGDGAGNQSSIDEIGLGGLLDGSDVELGLVQPVLASVGGLPLANGMTGVAKHSDPSIEAPTPAVDYRTAYFSFGFEGINTTAGLTSRAQLLSRTLDWLTDDVFVKLLDADETSPGAEATIACAAASSRGASSLTYRWLIAAQPGAPGEDARLVATEDPAVQHTFVGRGDYGVVVEVTDALGHTAIGSGQIRVRSGGTSSLVASAPAVKPGEPIVFELVLRNTEAVSLPFAFELPLPSGSTYSGHVGGTYGAATLSWSGTVGAQAAHTAVLTTTAQDLDPNSVIVARADILAGDDVLERSARVVIALPTYLPLVFRGQ
jgi:hypothetical protein